MPTAQTRFVGEVLAIVGVACGTAFARLPLRRQSALDTPALGLGPALGLRPIDDLLLFVHADGHVPDDQVHHPETAIQLFHQLTRPVDHVLRRRHRGAHSRQPA